METTILLLIIGVCVGYLGGLAQDRKESYKAYHKGKADGIAYTNKIIESFKAGKESAFERDLELIKSVTNESGGENE